MKRDFDLIRKILLDVEAAQAFTSVSKFEYEGFDQDTVCGHLEILIQAEMIKGEMIRTRAHVFPNVTGLTWKGHDFLDGMKDDSIWNKAKHSVLKHTGGVAFEVLSAWLKSEALAKLGLPHGG